MMFGCDGPGSVGSVAQPVAVTRIDTTAMRSIFILDVLLLFILHSMMIVCHVLAVAQHCC
jgi:hypothetical protein